MATPVRPAHAPLAPRDGRTWRIGLVGAGNIARFHLPAWQHCADAEAVAICDPDIRRAHAGADAFGVRAVHASIEEMLDAGGLDALDILSPRETHAEMVRRAARAGLPVLCQKPLTNFLDESRQLVREVEARIRLMVNENSRFRPQYRQIGAWLAAGALGEVRQVRDTMVSSGFLSQHGNEWPPDIARQPSFRSEKRMLIAEALIHQIDMLRSLLGPLRLLGARAGRTSSWVVGEDMATMLLETKAGAPVVVEGNRSAPGTRPDLDEDMLVVGSRATARLTGHTLALLGPAPETHTYDRAAAIQTGFDHAARHFIECLQMGAAFETDPHDNLQTLDLVERAYEDAGLA